MGAGGLLHTEMANVKGQGLPGISRRGSRPPCHHRLLVERRQIERSVLSTNAAGATVFGGTLNRCQRIRQQLLHAQPTASGERGSGEIRHQGAFDFDLSASRYDYLQDIQRNPFNVLPNSASFTPYGSIARMDGTIG
jgi:iron complex outermembrane receptor protein